MQDRPVRRVVIVGGGSAGWLTAGTIASEYAVDESGVSVTLVESPDVGTIGVGEGTWPTMRSTLRRIGLSETEFIRHCAASLKQGTKFVGWVGGGEDDVYYHPFTAPARYAEVNLVPHWNRQRDRVSFVNAVCAQGHLCERNLAPKQAATPEFAAVANYAYHLDAGKFAELLTKHCTEKLDVRHVKDHVIGIEGSPDQDIRGVQTRSNGLLEGDLFIDCTGSSSMLLGQHFGVSFVECKHVLFNDAAIAAQVPYEDQEGPVASQTISTARHAGWVWDISLANRRGIGYTYSGSHTSDDEAERVLRDYIAVADNLASDYSEPRKFKFRPGHRERFWHRNCVAIGMSSGFLEPLEASALVMIELGARMIADELPAGRSVMDVVARRYNEKFRYRWDRIVDFLKLHYVLSQRDDGGYWGDNRRPESIPDSLSRMLELWRTHVPWHDDFSQRDEVFSSASYQYVLYGMGHETTIRPSASLAHGADRAHRLFVENNALASKWVDGLPTNRELLTAISERGLPPAE